VELVRGQSWWYWLYGHVALSWMHEDIYWGYQITTWHREGQALQKKQDIQKVLLQKEAEMLKRARQVAIIRTSEFYHFVEDREAHL